MTKNLLWLVCLFTAVACAQPQEIILHDFGTLPAGTKGANPSAGVTRDAAGNLYGTTVNGGAFNYGTVYKIDTAGQERVLYSFPAEYSPDGSNPTAGVILDAQGNLYGTTPGAGYYDAGVVYMVSAKGQETVLYHFCQQFDCADGEMPSSGVIRDSAGNLYGVTSHGGASNAGVVYQIDPTGVETVLYSFTGGADGAGPNSLIRDEAGNLFGTTAGGGAGQQGVVFKLDSAGQLSVVYYFYYDGTTPVGVTRDKSGNLYGVTSAGGASNAGTVFKISVSGVEQVLYSFTGGSDGGSPAAGVVMDAEGNLYGTTSKGGSYSQGAVYKVDTSGQETVIYSFNGTGGSAPVSGVILDNSGNLYGTTPSPNLGVVYKINPAGQETVLTSFAIAAPPDGVSPSGGLTEYSPGRFYGATSGGGAAGYGVVFTVDTSGRETLFYSFGGGADGYAPSGEITIDPAGNLYGTAAGGVSNQGVVYKLDPSGQEAVLYSFTGGADGGGPEGGVALDTEGNLYGTASSGGLGHGVVFKIDPAGSETVLHNFGGGDLGDYPNSGVTRDSAGNLYGATGSGGVANLGIIFKVDAAGRFTILHSFTGSTDGGNPNGGLILDHAGNLYGTSASGGTANAGVIFEMDPTGQETVLYNFCSQIYCADGGAPDSGVIRDAEGNLYGTTYGTFGYISLPAVAYELAANGQETVLHTFCSVQPDCADGIFPGGVIRNQAGNLFGTTGSGGTKSGGVAFEITGVQ